jgi:hypothetical protein
MDDIVIGGFSITATTLGLVELASKLGVTGNTKIVLSVIVATLLSIGANFARNGNPVDFAGWFTIFVAGLSFGLAASGLYSFGKNKVGSG